MQPPFLPEHPLIVARNQVSLPKDAFTRALPFSVNEAERFRLDAMVMCADIMASAYEQMVELELRFKWEERQNENQPSGRFEIAMFQHAWSIVDQIYALRKLFRSLAFGGEDIDAFMSATSTAPVLRNRTDHLDQLINNIVAAKGGSRSLFGSLSYFVSGAAIGAPNVDVFAVSQHADPVRSGEKIASIRIPADLRMPIGNFVLAAAGEELDIDAAILTLGAVMTRKNERIEKSIRSQVAEKAVELGRQEGELLAHYGARLKIMFAGKLGATGEGMSLSSTPGISPTAATTNRSKVPG